MLGVTLTGGVLGAALGASLASFGCCVADRRQSGESIVKPLFSRCNNCYRDLAAWENIPVVSWMALRGRCRTCRAPIPHRYVVVEAALALAGAAAGAIALRGMGA
jgi:leader peptidase (prepilin peptidase)/N-methyltransferase